MPVKVIPTTSKTLSIPEASLGWSTLSLARQNMASGALAGAGRVMGTRQQLLLHFHGPSTILTSSNLPRDRGAKFKGSLHAVHLLRRLKHWAGAAATAEFCSESIIWLLVWFQIPLKFRWKLFRNMHIPTKSCIWLISFLHTISQLKIHFLYIEGF